MVPSTPREPHCSVDDFDGQREQKHEVPCPPLVPLPAPAPDRKLSHPTCSVPTQVHLGRWVCFEHQRFVKMIDSRRVPAGGHPREGAWLWSVSQDTPGDGLAGVLVLGIRLLDDSRVGQVTFVVHSGPCSSLTPGMGLVLGKCDHKMLMTFVLWGKRSDNT